ncbi:MAG TPA: PaaI family thioesterase [Acidobacteriota bacterium]|jgi:uncharacterized protein (TIGR00369 family)|nr:PaaI family thioesterase [Acidobacteriota bacterium]
MGSQFEVWEERAKISRMSRFVGHKLEVLEEGVCKIELPFREEFEQIFGVVHGGFITLIADAAGYFAAATKVGEIPLATSEIKMNFISPVYRKNLYAIGKVIKSGKFLTVCELKVYTEDPDKLIAVGLASYSRIPQKKDSAVPAKG